MKRREFITLSTGLTASGAIASQNPSSSVAVPSENTPKLANDYFEFTPEGTECLIKQYDTPVRWLNLLSNGRFVAWAAHDGTIVESCLIDNQNNRLTNPQSGYLYIRDSETAKHFMLNRPTQSSVWSAAQGLGYTRVTHSALGLTVTATYFCPREDDVLLWLISIRNTTSKARSIDVFSVVEWCLGDVNYSSELPGGDFHSIYNNFKKVSFDGSILSTNPRKTAAVSNAPREESASSFSVSERASAAFVLCGNNYSWGTLGAFQGQKVWPYTAFLASSLPVKGFDCDKESFFGRRIDLDRPLAVTKGQCGNEAAFGFTAFPLGVLQNSLQLAGESEQTLVVMAGMVRERDDAAKIREKYVREGAAQNAFQELKQFWTDFTARSLWVDTPEKDIDRLVNIWIKYQHRNSMLENLNTKRLGFGIWCPAYSYGAGRMSDIRETGNVTCDLKLIRDDILDYLHGGPLLLESDLKLKWEEPKCTPPPPAYPHDGRGLWPYPVCWYIKETGDLSFLKTPIDHHGQIPSAPKSGTLSLYDTMRYAIDWALSGLSERGLPRLVPGYGDWNDALNLISRDGRGESIFTATELCYMLRECAEIAEAIGKPQDAKDWTEKYDRIKTAVNTHAWDGDWYIRAFTDEGEPVGSSRNKEGIIYHSVQAYAVLSGVADQDRASRCLASVDRHLMTEFGPRICAPAYTKPAYDVGIVGDFGPGWRENGGIWNRTTGWTVMANCVANRANEAFKMYRKASIHHPSQNTDRFWLPPYVYPEFLVGEGPAFGRAQFQWCVGKAGTMWRAYTYFILGVRPTLKGLLIDPKIPNGWPRYRVKRPFRGAVYDIEVSNPNSMNGGVNSLQIDGKHVSGNVIPPHADGGTHTVKVILGY